MPFDVLLLLGDNAYPHPRHHLRGDRIVIVGHRVGEHERDGEILEVRDPDGGPPYVARWSDDGHEGLFFPGSDARIVHYEHGAG